MIEKLKAISKGGELLFVMCLDDTMLDILEQKLIYKTDQQAQLYYHGHVS